MNVADTFPKKLTAKTSRNKPHRYLGTTNTGLLLRLIALAISESDQPIPLLDPSSE